MTTDERELMTVGADRNHPKRSGKKKVKKRLSLHLTLTENITRRYWLLPFESSNY
ncbi:MAG: hypothetical protein ABIS69_11480 [Sediminibacterium sp.]